MISYSQILKEVLTERMSFKDLYRNSDPERIDRSRSVYARSLKVTTMDGNEAWTFSYKSNPSTTGQRWNGYVRFLKGDVSGKDRADELDCMVDCNCPDYRFRWAYNNAKQDAGALGPTAWNDNNGRPPRPREQGGVGDLGPGMCKHLIALGEFLKTKIEPDAPEPDEQPEPEPQVAPKRPLAPPVQKTRPSIEAPNPEDTYNDSREGGYTDSRSLQQESVSNLYKKMDELVKSSPEFDVWYDEDDDDLGYKQDISEDFHHHHKDYRLYEGNRHIVAVFEDNTRLKFEVHFRNNRGEDKEKWRKKALTTWKSLANEIHRDVQLSDAFNPMQKSWKESFSEALKHPKMEPFVRINKHQRVFPDKGYPAEVQGKPQPVMDGVNFTPRT